LVAVQLPHPNSGNCGTGHFDYKVTPETYCGGGNGYKQS
jgi:hypothetical protein